MTQPTMAPDSNALLTAELLDKLMARAPQIAAQADRLLAPIAAHRDQMRARLLDTGKIVPIGPETATPYSMAAVDGALVTQQLYAADLIVAVAASADAMTSTLEARLASRDWAQVVEHSSDNSRLASAAMAALEVQVLAEITHDLRIMDGSHGTPIIALSTGLFANNPAVRAAVSDLFTDELLNAVSTIANPSTEATVIALPKSDSSHGFRDQYQAILGDAATPSRPDDAATGSLTGGDRFLAAQVLDPGEMLTPRTVSELSNLHFPTPKDADRQLAAICDRFDTAIAPLRRAATQDLLHTTYCKPDGSDTVIKVEFRTDSPDQAITEGQRLARILSKETPAPYLQEPFVQYAVDLAAKAVSAGADALGQALIEYLPAHAATTYLPLLLRSYRTKAAPTPGRGQ